MLSPGSWKYARDDTEKRKTKIIQTIFFTTVAKNARPSPMAVPLSFFNCIAFWQRKKGDIIGEGVCDESKCDFNNSFPMLF